MTAPRILDRKTAVPALVGDPADFLIVAGLWGAPGTTVSELEDRIGEEKRELSRMRAEAVSSRLVMARVASNSNSPCSVRINPRAWR